MTASIKKHITLRYDCAEPGFNAAPIFNAGGETIRHILGLSGGKDSTALAIYLSSTIPDLELVFCDTGAELPETYEYLDKIEHFLGREIIRLKDTDFDSTLDHFGGFLPSPMARWCTRILKIKPFERYIGQDEATVYIGIRADEDRSGNFGKRKNIAYRYPFKEDGLVFEDVKRILDEAGIGIPKYYKWRTRSGCYFCFFQRVREWYGLYVNHPHLWEKAKAYEKGDFTWRQQQPLEALEPRFEWWAKQIQFDFGHDEEFEKPCLICDL